MTDTYEIKTKGPLWKHKCPREVLFSKSFKSKRRNGSEISDESQGSQLRAGSLLQLLSGPVVGLSQLCCHTFRHNRGWKA